MFRNGLIVFAVCFLPAMAMYSWWPLFVIALGLGKTFSARGPHALGSGVTTTGMGVWLLIAANDWYGLGWSRSWPLALVAAGLGSLVQAIAASMWRGSEERHEC